jgi:hypothetical protein
MSLHRRSGRPCHVLRSQHPIRPREPPRHVARVGNPVSCRSADERSHPPGHPRLFPGVHGGHLASCFWGKDDPFAAPRRQWLLLPAPWLDCMTRRREGVQSRLATPRARHWWALPRCSPHRCSTFVHHARFTYGLPLDYKRRILCSLERLGSREGGEKSCAGGEGRRRKEESQLA